MNKVYLGDCLEVMKTLDANSVDAIVTDPPYGLSFMGKKWDYDVPSQEIWEECLRVLKPGGYLLSFAGTRTQHRMAVRIEDAGFEIRDMIAWVYGSGFPKSLNIGKAVDKLQGNERIATGEIKHHAQKGVAVAEERGAIGGGAFGQAKDEEITKGTSEWEGWGTALKPALEPITVARKPLSEKTVAENVLKWGTGGVNIDESRVEYTSEKDKKEGQSARPSKTSNANDYSLNHGGLEGLDRSDRSDITGRFPANLIHDGSDEVVGLFPQTKSGGGNKNSVNNQENSFLGTGFGGTGTKTDWKIDSGSASRFFYCAKASKSERNKGCEGLDEKKPSVFEFRPTLETARENWATPIDETPYGRGGVMKNNHPTVKPIALMEYLVKLVTKKGGTVLDPFAGSGSTLVAAKNLGFNYIGIELTPEYIPIIEARLKDKPNLFNI